jgi:hypothetical protein
LAPVRGPSPNDDLWKGWWGDGHRQINYLRLCLLIIHPNLLNSFDWR